MKVISKIKTLLSEQIIRLSAAICDTRRIPSNVSKMILLMKVLYRERPDVMQIGGATNRLVVQFDGYIFKFALDAQGYEDNLMEFSLCEELTVENVTKSFETNGYILVAETVRLMTKEEWINRKGDILRKLDRLSKDYLLGDVGYDELNMTNWGLRDNGDVVILDYAYIHRATERLFTCPECGSVLTYNQYYTGLMCSNMASCHARFTYSEMKRIQGSQIDRETVAERTSTAIKLPGEQYEKEINTVDGSTLVGGDVVVIHNSIEYEHFKRQQESGVPTIRGDGIVPYSDTPEEDDKYVTELMRMEDKEEARRLYLEFVNKRCGISTKNNEPVKYVLADDYYEIPKKSVGAKPIDRNYGESEEEYRDRKKKENLIKEEDGIMLDLSRKLTEMGNGKAFAEANGYFSSGYDNYSGAENDDNEPPRDGYASDRRPEWIQDIRRCNTPVGDDDDIDEYGKPAEDQKPIKYMNAQERGTAQPADDTRWANDQSSSDGNTVKLGKFDYNYKDKGPVILGKQYNGKGTPTAVKSEGASYHARMSYDQYYSKALRLMSVINNETDPNMVAKAEAELERLKNRFFNGEDSQDKKQEGGGRPERDTSRENNNQNPSRNNGQPRNNNQSRDGNNNRGNNQKNKRNDTDKRNDNYQEPKDYSKMKPADDTRFRNNDVQSQVDQSQETATTQAVNTPAPEPATQKDTDDYHTVKAHGNDKPVVTPARPIIGAVGEESGEFDDVSAIRLQIDGKDVL